ncbi:hypothetical protein AB1Y20_012888 [Prymnesium parvum]|uniref:Uncharacterized protein n=1 Tax=Prymnesium parvum TaxID=97485 RepID=A0AB34IL56_PRYPA|mmetsp:Transcript_47134/g.83202  ORF Transcript_47134/g.83202 Transcript_47134/m.83202 type:complete len:107 (+) Transcript_47134:3-323(+)
MISPWLALLLGVFTPATSLQLGATLTHGRTMMRPIALRPPPPRAQFGGGEPERTSITRDSEPDDFFKTNMDDMSDAEKIKSPGVIIGLAILILPFIAGLIALQVYK